MNAKRPANGALRQPVASLAISPGAPGLTIELRIWATHEVAFAMRDDERGTRAFLAELVDRGWVEELDGDRWRATGLAVAELAPALLGGDDLGR